MRQQAKELFDRLGVRINPDRPARGLSIADQQIVEIAKALSFDARGGPDSYRLANLVAQRKARWLQGRVDELFLE